MSNQQETVTNQLIHGAVTVGTTKVQLSSSTHKLYKGVVIKADGNNGGTVFVGGPVVAASGANSGIPLSGGEGLTVTVEYANQLYVIASDADQVVYFLGQ